MGGRQKHIIQKLVVDLEYNGRANGLDLQTLVSRWCRDQLLPYLESLLDKNDEQNDIISISKMDIEVEVGLNDEWPAAVLEKSGIALKDKLRALPLSDKWKKQKEQPNGSYDHASIDRKEFPAHSHHSTRDRFIQALQQYLRTATLPWWWDNSLSLEDEFSIWVNGNDSEQFPVMLEEMLKDADAAMRLSVLCADEHYPLLISSLHPQRKQLIARILPQLLKLAGLFPDGKAAETRLLFKTTLVQLACYTDVLFVQKLLILTRQWLDKVCTEYELRSRLASQIKWKQDLLSHISNAITEIKNLLTRLYPALTDEVNTMLPDLLVVTGTKQAGKSDKLILVRPETQEFEDPSTGKEKDRDALHEIIRDEPLYVVNAGIMIIAPLLPTLFKRLGLLEDKEINDPAVAVLILHYITYGNEEAKEYEMPLYKILCGIPLKQAVNTRIGLEPEQKEEAGELLRSVIDYWTVLKETSPDALRSSFLQRNGKLILENNEWKLIVEQQPFDMLLQQLPWSIQMIRLSWMKNLVRTEWVG